MKAKDAEAAIIARAKATRLPTTAQVVAYLRAHGFEQTTISKDGTGGYFQREGSPEEDEQPQLFHVNVFGVTRCPDDAMCLKEGRVPHNFTPQYFMVWTLQEIALACGLSDDQWLDVAHVVAQIEVQP